MPAAAESALSTSGLMLELASKFLLGSGLAIRALLNGAAARRPSLQDRCAEAACPYSEAYEKKDNTNNKVTAQANLITSQPWYTDFERYVQLAGLAKRSGEVYLNWARQIARHYPDQPASELKPEQVIDFLIHLQNDRKLKGNTAKRTRLRVRALLGQLGEPTPTIPEQEPFKCDHCQGELKLTGKLKRIRPRGPPKWKYFPPKEDEPEEEQGKEATTDD